MYFLTSVGRRCLVEFASVSTLLASGHVFYLDERPYSPRIWWVSCFCSLSVDCGQFFVCQYSQPRRMYNPPEYLAWDLIPKPGLNSSVILVMAPWLYGPTSTLFTSAYSSTWVVGDMRRNEFNSFGRHSNCPGDELVSLPQKDRLLNKAGPYLAIPISDLDLMSL